MSDPKDQWEPENYFTDEKDVRWVRLETACHLIEEIKKESQSGTVSTQLRGEVN